MKEFLPDESQGLLIQKYPSKQNEVSLMKRPSKKEPSGFDYVIVKKFTRSQASFYWEREILQLLTGHVCVPKLLGGGGNLLVMEHIEGPTLLEWMEKEERENPSFPKDSVEKMFEKLIDWLAGFYQRLYEAKGKTYILCDINLRNFIMADCLYGFDFEDCREGRVEQDLARFAAFALLYDPPGTAWREQFVQLWLAKASDGFNIPQKKIEVEMDREMTWLRKRRRKKKETKND